MLFGGWWKRMSFKIYVLVVNVVVVVFVVVDKVVEVFEFFFVVFWCVLLVMKLS